MGMSLPFLVRATVRETASASRVIGVLYGVNVLGAAAGALLAPWVLMRFLGLPGAALTGTVANLVAAAAALAAGHRAGSRGRGGSDVRLRRRPRGPSGRCLRGRSGSGRCSTPSPASSPSRSRSPGSG